MKNQRQNNAHWMLLTDSEMEMIRNAAIDVLCSSGFAIQNPEILARLKTKGCRIDDARCRFIPDRKLIEQVEEAARRSAVFVPEPLLRRTAPPAYPIGHNFTCYYDWTEKKTRPATLGDIRNVTKAWHNTPQIPAICTCMTAQDVPSAIEPIVSTVEVIKLTPKIKSCPEMILESQLPFLEDLQSLMTGQPARFSENGCSVTRFCMDERAAACLLAIYKRNGLTSWWINSTPICGASAPITLAGAVTVGVAEILGGWFAGWALNEDTALGAIPLAGIVDMKSGRVLFSTTETILIDSALYQFFLHQYGIRIGLCPGWTDAKIPGLHAFHDKLLKGLAYGWFTDIVGGQSGALNAGRTYSPTQQLIDLELDREIARLGQGIRVTEETINLAEIKALAGEFNRMFLDTEHTATHFRRELWLPTLLDRSPYISDEDELRKDRQLLDAAESAWRDAMASYQPAPIDAALVQAAQKIADDARRLLLA